MSKRFVYYGAGVAAANLLLDSYPATVAYSLRKLRTAYNGYAIRVRRSSDNTEQDIGFSGGGLDTNSLLSFVGSGDGLIVKKYNQGSGGATYDASQTTASNQPFIALNGSIISDGGKPTVDFLTGASRRPPLNIANAITFTNAFQVCKINAQNTVNYTLGNESPGQGAFYNGSASSVDGIGAFDGVNAKDVSGEDLHRHLSYINMRSGNLYVSKDGSSENNLGSFASDLTVDALYGRVSSGNTYILGTGQETILYTTEQSANKAAIETNINNYYGIY